MSDVHLSTLKPGTPLGGFATFPHASPTQLTFQGCTFLRSGSFMDSSLTALAGTAMEYPAASVGLLANPVSIASLTSTSFLETHNQYRMRQGPSGVWAMAVRYFNGDNWYGTLYTENNFQTANIYNQITGPVAKCTDMIYFGGYWYYTSYNSSGNGYIARTNSIPTVAPAGVYTDASSNTALYCIATDGNIMVAVGGNGRIVTSTNGTTWTTRTVTGQTSVTRYAIDYIDGVFYAGGTGGQIATSTNGTTWTARTSAYGYNINKFVKFNGVVYAICDNIYTSASSNNGVTWTSGIVLPLPISRGTYSFCPVYILDGELYFVTSSSANQRISKYDTTNSTWVPHAGANQKVTVGSFTELIGTEVISISFNGGYVMKTVLNSQPIVGHPTEFNIHNGSIATDTYGAMYMRVK